MRTKAWSSDMSSEKKSGFQTDNNKINERTSGEHQVINTPVSKKEKTAKKTVSKSASKGKRSSHKTRRIKVSKSQRIKMSLDESLEREAKEKLEAVAAGVNPYFIELSKRCRTAKIVCAVTLALFAVVMLGSFRDDITAENLQYLLRDLNVTNTVYSSTSSATISYNTDTEAVFCMFRGNIVMSNRESFVLYSNNGSKIFSEEHNYKNPAVTSSEASVISYDLGGTSYAVYNTLGKIAGESTAYPISSASAAENGSYAIMTRSAEYRTVIYVYNSNKENIAQIMKDKLALGMGFNRNGDCIFILSIYNDNGSISGEISVYNPELGNELFTMTIDGELPMYAAFNDSGDLKVATEKALYIYSNSGELISKYSFENRTPQTVCVGNNYFAAVFSSSYISNESDIAVINDKGKTVLTYSVPGTVKKIKISDDRIYFLCSDKIICINPENLEVSNFKYDGNPCDINVSGDIIFVSYYSHTLSYYLSEVFDSENADGANAGSETSENTSAVSVTDTAASEPDSENDSEVPQTAEVIISNISSETASSGQ